MAQDQSVHNVCPHLGLKDDRDSHFAHPSVSHLCYSRRRVVGISEEHQALFCFTANYTTCPLFTAPRPRTDQADLSGTATEPALEGRSRWEILLWFLVSLGAFIAILIFLPRFLTTTNLFSVAQAEPTPTATPTTVQPPVRVTGTPLAIPTGRQPPPPARTQPPIILPTLMPNSELIVFQTNPGQSGWIAGGEDRPHLRERNLHAGFYQGKGYASIIQFNLTQLSARSQILFAAIELTGLSRDNLGPGGQWQFQLLDANPDPDWSKQNYDAIVKASAGSSLGPLEPADLTFAQLNTLVLNQDQLRFLEQRLSAGTVTLRITTTTTAGDSIFTWDGGNPNDPTGLTRPVLRVIAIPAEFVIITNTPTPANVLTAAAYVDAMTAVALEIGSPTPLPRGIFATTTPIIVIPYGGAQNTATATMLSLLATAVAKTTGTYTPIPPNVYTATPFFPTFTPLPTFTPAFVSVEQATPVPTRTPTPGAVDYFATPVDQFRNKVIFKRTVGLGILYTVITPSGQEEGYLTGPGLYNAAQVREFYAPDRSRRAIVAVDKNGNLQIMIEDLNLGGRTPITRNVRGIAYDPAWSPNGRYIAYISDETGVKEVYIYDLETNTTLQLTNDTGLFPDSVAKKHPSFSPDSQRIIFASRVDSYPNFQLWAINVDGSGLVRPISNQYDETDPIWVK